jgi:hypothetical protein
MNVERTDLVTHCSNCGLSAALMLVRANLQMQYGCECGYEFKLDNLNLAPIESQVRYRFEDI